MSLAEEFYAKPENREKFYSHGQLKATHGVNNTTIEIVGNHKVVTEGDYCLGQGIRVSWVTPMRAGRGRIEEVFDRPHGPAVLEIEDKKTGLVTKEVFCIVGRKTLEIKRHIQTGKIKIVHYDEKGEVVRPATPDARGSAAPGTSPAA